MLARFISVITLTVAFSTAADSQQAAPRQSPTGFSSVATAFEAMKGKPGVRVSVTDGWTVVDDRAAATIWSFTPPGHPAHPSAVKRTVVQEGAEIFIRMGVACEAKKPACDKLVAEFNQLNQRMRQDLNRR
jgi:hypothetical protein